MTVETYRQLHNEHAKKMPCFVDIISQYPVICNLASFLSCLDIFHLALASKACFQLTLSSKERFAVLRRDALCDGTGLAARQNFEGLYSLDRPRYYAWDQSHLQQDEPIEVELYARRCDETGALPCRKCGIPVCEVSLLLVIISNH